MLYVWGEHHFIKIYRTTYVVMIFLQQGAVGIFGPINPKTSRLVQSACDLKDVPHIEVRVDANQKRGDCHVNFYPHPSSLSQVMLCKYTIRLESFVFIRFRLM
jgi:hypothetical protein